MGFILFGKKDFEDPTDSSKYVYTLYGKRVPPEIVKEVQLLYEKCEEYEEEAIFYRIQYEREIRKNGTGACLKQKR